MQFNPQTDQQIQKEEEERLKNMLLPEGVYNCEIGEAELHVGKTSGKESIKLGMKVFKPDGEHILVWDYLTPNFPKKWKHAAEAFGLHREYSSGNIEPRMFEYKTGKVKLTINENKGTKYPPRNEVDDYHVPEGQKIEDRPQDAMQQQAPATNIDDDDIPF